MLEGWEVSRRSLRATLAALQRQFCAKLNVIDHNATRAFSALRGLRCSELNLAALLQTCSILLPVFAAIFASWGSNVGIESISRLAIHIDCTPELYHVIADEAPDAVKNGEIKNHFGRKVAIVSGNLFLFESLTDLIEDAFVPDTAI
jgi:hypothetical protein